MHCPEPKIGAYCLNEGREVCVARCAPEQKFRHLEPAPLDPWELPPEIPPMRTLVELNGHTVRGIFYLALCYQQQKEWQDA